MKNRNHSMAIAFALLISTAHGPAWSQDSMPPEAQQKGETASAKLTLAEQLAALANPTLNHSENIVYFQKLISPTLLADENFILLEKDYPGITAHVIGIVSEATAKQDEKAAPKLTSSLAKFYADELTETELKEVLIFYSSPTGQKLSADISDPESISMLVQDIAKRGNSKIEEADISKLMSDGSNAFQKNVDSKDIAALYQFAGMPVFKKLTAIRTKFETLAVDLANLPSPEDDAEIETVTENAIAEFIGRTNPELAKELKQDIFAK